MSLYLAGTIGTWWWLVAGWRGGGGVWTWAPPAGVLATVWVANQARSGYRRRVVAKALGAEALANLKYALRLDRWATTGWMALHWLLVVRACFGRTCRWRGTTYRLRGPQRVERLD